MDKCYRDSGIGAIGKIPWGTHIGQLYTSKEDCFDVMVPFMRSGLLNNEFCVWVYNGNEGHEEIKGNVRSRMENFDAHVEKGHLRLIPHTAWYLKDNCFQEIMVNKQWYDLIRYALDNGFSGLRAAADVSWLDAGYSGPFLNYERNINAIITGLPFLVVCQYDARKVDVFEIAGILASHDHVIARRGENPCSVINRESFASNGRLKDSLKRYRKSRRLLDEAMEYDRMKTEFLANISHEFRTPLNVILSAVQLLKLQGGRALHGHKAAKHINSIQQNCYRLIRLVNNLIDITKIDSNFYEIKLQNYDIIALVEGITLSVVEYAKNKGIQVVFNSSAREKVVACDPDQVERIILNLLSNAVKFTPNGGTIWVNISDNGEFVEISVKDTGIGIPEDKQKIIFQRFQQVDKSLRKRHEGSGIGLSLAKALVEKHGGTIALNSEPGKGSEFVISIPCRILPEKDSDKNRKYDADRHNRVEKIDMEFSDIYF